MKTLKNPIKIDNDGNIGFCERDAYARAKCAALKEFGYSGLTVEEVQKQIDGVLAGKTLKDGLTIIGSFMLSDLAPEIERRASLKISP